MFVTLVDIRFGLFCPWYCASMPNLYSEVIDVIFDIIFGPVFGVKIKPGGLNVERVYALPYGDGFLLAWPLPLYLRFDP